VGAWLPPLVVGLVAFGCSSTASRGAPATHGAASTTTPDVHVTAASFTSLRAMTPVRGFFVANVLGNLRGSLAIARSTAGGTTRRAPCSSWSRPRRW
jgi:hypothetical protein